MKKSLRKVCNAVLAFAIPFIFSFPIFKKLKKSMVSSLLFTGLLLLVSFNQAAAQTQFWSDTFEDSGAPSTGTRTPSLNTGGGGPPFTYYFLRTDGSNIAYQTPFPEFETLTSYQGKEGSKFWAGEDTDRVRTGSNNAADKVQTIEWLNIGIAGKTGITFKGLFACLQSWGWQNKNVFPDSYDLLEVEYKIDAGAWTRLGGFYAGPHAIPGGGIDNTAGLMSEDINNDFIGDNTNLLSRQFKDVTWSIPGTGTSLSLRFRASADAGAAQEFAIDNFRLFEAAVATPSITGNPPNRTLCVGSNTTFSITASNATSYQWQVDTGLGFASITNGAPYSGTTTPTLTITGATAGMSGYRYRAVASNGSNTAVSNNATLTISSITLGGNQTNVSCNGGNNGTATVSASGGIPGYTYSWAPSGGTAATATGLGVGTYTVTVTDAIGCTATRNFTIAQPSVLNATASAQTNIACNGAATGSATVSTTGGTPGYTYSWAPSGGTAATATGLVAGTYTVTVTDANGCTDIQSFTIVQPTALSVTPSQNNVSQNGGTNGSATVAVTGGSGPYTYSWAPSGGTAATASGLAAGTYTVTITDNNSCQKTQTFTITQPAAPTITTTQTNILCNSAATGSAGVSVSGGTGPYTYSWAPSGGTAAIASGLTAGSYTVTITDGNNSQYTRNFTITQPTAFSVTTSQTDVSCNGGNNGSAGVTVTGGTGAYTYSWAPSGGTAATATGLSAGSYTVTITDANNCQTTRNFTINQPQVLNATASAQTNIACNGGSTGSATVAATGGTGAYTYSWAPSGGTAATASGLAAGTYTVTVTDANGCTDTQSFTITQPTALSVTPSQNNVSQNGGTNGSATVVINGGSGPYTYSWAPSGGTAATASGLAAGTYTVTITDANACSTTQSFTITQPAAPTIATTQTNIACNSAATGSAGVIVSGGVGPYTYSWAPSGGTAATASGLTAGTYTVTITDGNNSQYTRNFTITQPTTALNATAAAQTNVSCNGGANGSATVGVTGGTPGYTYSWAPTGGTAAAATGLVAGTYTVTVTDANGCTDTQSFTITQPSALNATAAAQTNVSCNGGTNGTATVGVTGGTGSYTYSWAPSGGTAATATGLAAGTYTVTVTDANTCSTTQSFTITQPSILNATPVSQTNIACNGSATGSATVSATGGTPSYTYSWAPTGGTAATATGLVAGTYTVTVTDANGCTDTQSFTITQPSALNATAAAQTNVSCNGGANGSATVSVTGGTPGYTYSWAPSGGTAATATGLAAGTYTVTVTDANGCTDTQSFTLTQPPAFNVTPSFTSPTSFGGTNGSASVSVSGGTGAYTYSWAPSGGTAATATGLTAGTYTVTITDANTCTTTSTITLVNPTVVSSVSATNANGNYKAGTNIHINITFSEPVTITGTPTLALNTGETATYSSGSGTNTLAFTYTVGAVQTTDLDYSSSSALSLSGGSIKNGNGINATLTLPNPGSAGSLGANKNIVVDGISPTVTSITRVNSSPSNASTVAYTVSFSEAVIGVDATDFSIFTAGAITGNVASISGSGSVYNVTINPVIGTGTLRLDVKSSGTGITDSFNNPINTGYTSGQIYDIDQTPAISTSGTLSALNTTYGTVSSNTSFSVSAINLTAAVTIAAPSGFELSTNSSSGFANAISVGSTGTLASTTIYVRLKADARPVSSPYSGNITLSTTGGSTLTMATVTSTVALKPITLVLNANPVVTKAYDGNTNANLATSNYALNGVVGSDQLSVSGNATYANADVGTNKTITANTFVLAGAEANNYNLMTTSATSTGTITPKTITLSINANPLITKIYDKTNAATLVAANYNLSGVVGSEQVGVSATAAYADESVEIGKTVTVGTLALTGAAASNYLLTTTSATTTGNITSKAIALTLNAIPLITKVYDGTNTATLIATNYTLTGMLGGDVVTVSGTATYADANIGVGKTITVGTFVLAGAAATNYHLTIPSATTTGDITPKPITLTLNALPLITKTYDGTTTATLAPGNYNLSGISGSDQVTVSGTANYDSKGKGNAKPVIVTNFVLAGTQAANYSLSTSTAITTGNILAKPLILVLNNNPAISKVYDGTTAISLTPNNYSLTGAVLGDNLAVDFKANYINKDVGPQKNITVSEATLSGTNANNYSLNFNQAGATGAITPKSMSIIADAKSKAIGAADPVLTYTANGLLGNDALTGSLTRSPGENAGSYAITQGTLSAGANYTVAFTPSTLTIGGQFITVTAVAKTKTYGNADPEFTYTVTGLAPGDVLTGNLSRSTGENAGSYAINVGTLSGGSKYSINYVGASLIINKAVLQVTATNKQLCLGASIPAFEISYAGFKNGDDANNLVTKPTVTTTATSSSPAGNYALVPSNGAADNYTFVYVNGQLTINAFLVATINANSGTTLAKGQIVSLTASGGTSYVWANADGIISGQNTATLIVGPTTTTTYTVTVTNAGGCSATASITLTVNDGAELVIEANNIMTPNGDGVNDKWVIKDIELYPNNLVKIFDRGGRIVFSQKGYKNSWDATLRGAPLAEGTYYFIIDLGDGKTIKKGYITIIKK